VRVVTGERLEANDFVVIDKGILRKARAGERGVRLPDQARILNDGTVELPPFAWLALARAGKL